MSGPMQGPRDSYRPLTEGRDLMIVLAAFLLLGMALTVAPPARCCDVICERNVALDHFSRKEVRQAVERLRVAVSRFPDDAVLPLLLARGYLLEGNLFWAERTLREILNRRPETVEARLWLACVHLQQGDLGMAQQVAASGSLNLDGASRSRRILLEALGAMLGAEPARARAALSGMDEEALVFSEDLAVWRMLQRQLDPWWMNPMEGDVEVIAGYTSNALAGSPTDPGATGTGSWFGDMVLRTRIAPRISASFRPVLDLDVSGHGLTEESSRELSSLDTGARAGGLITTGNYRTLLGYRAEALFLNQSPSRYSEAHRGEIEIESVHGWLAFGGAGRRTYRDDGRTRTEWDLGAGGPLSGIPRTSLVLGTTVRGGSARSPAYDFLGVSLAVAARTGLGGGVAIRVAATASWDDYPHSGGLEGALVFGTTEKRRDILGRATVEILLPEWHGLRLGVEGQIARRDSTADDRPGFDFDYTELRAGIALHFKFGANPGAPRVEEPAGHVRLEWGVGHEGESESERIIELLRQDEDLRRGSSCRL